MMVRVWLAVMLILVALATLGFSLWTKEPPNGWVWLSVATIQAIGELGKALNAQMDRR